MKLPHYLLFCACISVSGLTMAQGHGHMPQPGRGSDRGGNAPAYNLDRNRPERNERFAPQQDQQGQQHMQMSDEERRQLRRDVNDAGREIYRRPDRF